MGQSSLIAGLLLIVAVTAAIILWRGSTAPNRRSRRRQLRRARFEQREMIDMFAEDRGTGTPVPKEQAGQDSNDSPG